MENLPRFSIKTIARRDGFYGGLSRFLWCADGFTEDSREFRRLPTVLLEIHGVFVPDARMTVRGRIRTGNAWKTGWLWVLKLIGTCHGRALQGGRLVERRNGASVPPVEESA